jgi:hypothetical protein
MVPTLFIKRDATSDRVEASTTVKDARCTIGGKQRLATSTTAVVVALGGNVLAGYDNSPRRTRLVIVEQPLHKTRSNVRIPVQDHPASAAQTSSSRSSVAARGSVRYTSLMGDPYLHECPSCGAGLREHGGRLCCDHCHGMFLTSADLARAIDEITAVACSVTFRDDARGDRTCPRCSAAMVVCRLTVQVDSNDVQPKTALERCDEHGVWFDDIELADVFRVLHAATSQRRFPSARNMDVSDVSSLQS